MLPLLGVTAVSAQEKGETARGGSRGELGVPGPYPGRVVEVRNPALVKDGKRNREAVRSSLNRGLTELTGADSPVEAWRTFVQPGEAVGIKVVPNGYPGAHTSPELVLEVIDGLKAAGIKPKDMVVFDRYGVEFLHGGLPEDPPGRRRVGGLTPVAWDPGQLDHQLRRE